MVEQTPDIKIGLEIHVSLNTKTKLFCGCEIKKDAEPNSMTCPICLGHPGSRPTLNRQAVLFALKVCLAFDSKIADKIIFSRKTYFYPDMSKNYQITQYEEPLGSGGELTFSSGKKIRLRRVHVEEDPAALIHPTGVESSAYVLVDYNRSGIPLVEIVTEPDMSSPEEARDFMNQLRKVIEHIGVYDVDNCIVKADVNVSIKESRFIRAEVKNVSGFKQIEDAIIHEVARQRHVISEGGKLHQETRAWNAEFKKTSLLRTKETEEDYGYITEPDIPPITITKDLLKEAFIGMPMLPQEKERKYIRDYKISKEDAQVLSSDAYLSTFFEEVAKKIDPKIAARFVRVDLVRVASYHNKRPEDIPAKPEDVVVLLQLLDEKKINEHTVKKIMEELSLQKIDVMKFITENNLLVVSDSGELRKLVEEIIKENPGPVQDFKSGNEKALNFLIGQAKKKSKGTADTNKVTELLRSLLM